ncbi:MAG: thiolase family protein [Thermodesulfobacteriota bacterium]
MPEVMVLGVGMVPFGKHFERTLVNLAAEAAWLALRDADIRPDRIGLGFFASATAAPLLRDVTVGQNVFWEVGLNRLPVFNVENACTSGSTAFYLAANAVAAGQAEAVLVVGAEKMLVPSLGLINSGATELETQLGLVAPAGFALRARRHMAEFGTTIEQLALVSVKNRSHARLNPLAMLHHKPLSLEEVLAAPLIVDPLTRFMCCPSADGAAAIVLGSAAQAGNRSRAIPVRAWVYCTGGYENPQDLARWETDYRACRTAYEKAGLGPADLDVIECHDAFAIAELLHYEALGLCAAGESGGLAAEGRTTLSGDIPVNVSGGLLSRGHPPGATGLAQVHEIVTQLRGEAGPRQVSGARVGLAHCMGGDKAADAKSCTVLVFTDS